MLVGLIALTCLPRFEILPGTDNFGTWFLIPVNLLTGAVLATRRPKPRTGWLSFGIVGLIAVVCNGVVNVFHPFGPVMGVVTTLVVWAFATTRVGVPRSLKLSTTAGKWSYGIYLFHLPFCSAALLMCRFARLDHLGTIGYFVAAVVIATAAATALAATMYTAFERPILARRKRITEHLGANAGDGIASIARSGGDRLLVGDEFPLSFLRPIAEHEVHR